MSSSSSLTKSEIEKLKVPELQKELTALGLDIKGLKKAELQAKLLEHLENQVTTNTMTTPTVVETTETISPVITTTTTSPTVTASTTTSTTSSSNADKDLSKMTQQERMIYRAEKFKTNAPATATPSSPSTSSTSSSSSPKLTNAEKEKLRRERFGSLGNNNSSNAAEVLLNTGGAAKVKKSKAEIKESIIGTEKDLQARKKRFSGGKMDSQDIMPESEEALNRRLQRFASKPGSTPAAATATTIEKPTA